MTQHEPLPFLRARTADQRRDRRSRLLDAARGLLATSPAMTVTLQQIGDAAGLAKSGVLRYVGSLEALLLQVMYAEHLEWVDSLSQELSAASSRPGPALAATLAARPVLCDLIGASPILLGRLSEADRLVVRDQGADIQRRLGTVLKPYLGLSGTQVSLLTAAIHAFVGTGTAWTAPPAAPTAPPEPFLSDFESTLAELLEVFLAGLGSYPK
jgi:AcrR family transcriptional regulator